MTKCVVSPIRNHSCTDWTFRIHPLSQANSFVGTSVVLSVVSAYSRVILVHTTLLWIYQHYISEITSFVIWVNYNLQITIWMHTNSYLQIIILIRLWWITFCMNNCAISLHILCCLSPFPKEGCVFVRPFVCSSVRSSVPNFADAITQQPLDGFTPN